MDLAKFMVVALSPKLARFLGFSALDPVLSKFFIDIVRKTMENRRYRQTSDKKIFIPSKLSGNLE